MRSFFAAAGRYAVKVLHEASASLWGFLLAAGAFWSGWHMHAAVDQHTGGPELRAAQIRCLNAQADQIERLSVTIPGPETYTPAEPATGSMEPTPAEPQTGEDVQ